MKKRIFMAAVLAIAALLLLSSCSKDKKRILYVYNWSYYTPDEVIDSFEEEYSCKVVMDYFASNEEMFAKVMASGGGGYDIIFPSGDYTSIMIKLGMLEEIDLSRIPNAEYITELVRNKASYDHEMKYSVPYFMGAAGIAVNKTKLKDYDKSWSIFSREDLKGRMCMMDDVREVIGDALIYLGYSCNTDSDEELQEAFDLIVNKWKPNLTKFDAEGFAKSFATGEYTAAHGYAESFFEELPEERWNDVDFFIPEEGGTMYIDNMCIPKNAPHYDLAIDFINYIHKPENYAKFLDRFHFPASVNSKAEEYRTTVPFYTTEDLQRCETKDDLAENLAKYNELWERIRYVN